MKNWIIEQSMLDSWLLSGNIKIILSITYQRNNQIMQYLMLSMQLISHYTRFPRQKSELWWPSEIISIDVCCSGGEGSFLNNAEAPSFFLWNWIFLQLDMHLEEIPKLVQVRYLSHWVQGVVRSTMIADSPYFSVGWADHTWSALAKLYTESIIAI